MTRILTRLLEHPWTVLLVLGLVVLGIGHRAAFLIEDNSPETFYAIDRSAQETYEALVATFAVDEPLLVELRGARIDRAEDLDAIAELAERLRRVPGISRAMAITDVVDSSAGVAEREAALERQVEALPAYAHLGLVRPEIPALGVAASVVVRGPRARGEVSDRIYEITRDFEARGYRTLVAGLTAAHAAIDVETRRTMRLFMPLVMLLVGLIGLLLFRSPSAVIAMLLPVAGTVAVGAGTIELLGQTLNLVSAVMPPLVLAIGFAGATHIVSHYASCVKDGCSPEQAVERAVLDKIQPTAFAFLTTAVGFGSLALSEVQSVRVLGVSSFVALIAAVLLVSIGTPALLRVLRPRPHMPAGRRRVLEHLARFALQRRALVLVIATTFFAVLALGVPRLTTSADGMELLGDHVAAKRDFRQLESEGLGLYSLDLWIKQESSLLQLPDHAERLARLAEELERDPMVRGGLGVHDLLIGRELQLSGRAEVPATLVTAMLMPATLGAQLVKRLAPMWSAGGGHRLVLLTNSVEMGPAAALASKAERLARRAFPGVEAVATGHFMMLIGTPGKLMETLFTSLTVTACIIAALFSLAFRSPRLVAAAMLANLLPVVAVVGGMGWAGIPLDVATVMIASIVFGIAVDDTFHYLYHRKRSGDLLRAARIAGQGIVATSFMVGGGLSVLGLSGFVPVVRFGLLTAAGVGVALLVDAFVLPILVGEGRATPLQTAPEP